MDFYFIFLQNSFFLLVLEDYKFCASSRTRTYELQRGGIYSPLQLPLCDTGILSFLLDLNQRHLGCKPSALPTELRKDIVTPSGLEPETPVLKARCSSQLSYKVILLPPEDSNLNSTDQNRLYCHYTRG